MIDIFSYFGHGWRIIKDHSRHKDRFEFVAYNYTAGDYNLTVYYSSPTWDGLMKKLNKEIKKGAFKKVPKKRKICRK